MSSLNLFDIICMQANFHYLAEERFQCDDKIANLAKRSSWEEATRLIRAANNCDKILDKPLYNIDNIKYHTCFCQFRHPKMALFLTLFNQYEKGILPFPGSFIEQPNYIVEVFSILSRLKMEKEEEDAKRKQAENGGRIDRHRAGNQGVQQRPQRKR